ncbi:Clf1p Ecym_4243 [Eremothecium cymbalariae DBVPG|uniref:Pre-mRNA-splicing factor CLF1 n=1 Tax=Eremothecium cymbalariae (strain CBS 270.75 / DBVPG 7215 / KCTC 17166 / NRRL Y-17582) TaxID=931890 RepID=G8JTF5_ERECY|nr:hypothetical protein Ecym_4243 [Eremothecium cymbalariae DBVPG\
MEIVLTDKIELRYMVNVMESGKLMDEIGEEVISADHILEEAYETRKEVKPSTKVAILDLEELKDWQRRKRTEYEEVLKRNRLDLRQWMRYGQFELEQHDIRRARSIFERALLVSSSYIPLWVRYIDSELKLKNVNHARNLLHRATSLLPRVDKLWYKYVFVEESLGHVEVVRGLYTKWCSLEPGTNVWDSYIGFEARHGNLEQVRNIFAKYILVHPKVDTWLKWVSYESKHGSIDTIRRVYSLALDTLSAFDNIDKNDLERLIVSFANWEASQQEFERCRSLYDITIRKLPNSKTLKDAAIQFEKKFGDGTNINDSITFKRKTEYENYLVNNPTDYDMWWLYIDLIAESFTNHLRPVYERATASSVPPGHVKSIAWRRYIYIWIRYLIYLESIDVAAHEIRAVYQRLIKEIIPNKKFTFAKIWIMYSQFEIRQGEVTNARKILGMSLGLCPKKKLFRYYIDLEIKLKEFDRVRKLYEKYLDFDPLSLNTWIEYAELEENLGDEERSRGIYEIALSDEVEFPIDDRLKLIARFIQFETDVCEYSRARNLYDKYLIISDYDVKVWIKYALFESSVPTNAQLAAYEQKINENEDEESDEEEFEITEDNKNQTRSIFEKALNHFAQKKDSQNRILILEAYKQYEHTHGSPITQEKIASRYPTVVKRKAMQDGIEREYIEYIFMDDNQETAKPDLSRLVSLARNWDIERRK